MRDGEKALLEALNSTPVRDGVRHDLWREGPELDRWMDQYGTERGEGDARSGGGSGERKALLAARDALQAVVRGEQGPEALGPCLRGARQVPRLSGGGLEWALEVAAERRPAVELVLAWAQLEESSPGRLRACANDACRLFLLDRSRANSARWCSMKTCGNRLKARRHHERQREGRGTGGTAH